MFAYVFISSESKRKKLVKMLDSNEGVMEGERHMLLYFLNYELVNILHIQKLK